MNLQLCVPYEKCPFKCPMCIAKNPHVFDNIYERNCFTYFFILKDVLEKNDYKSVVLTGDTEPSLNKKWVEEVADLVKIYSSKSKVEIQTHNYNWKGSKNVDVNAFSVTTTTDIKNINKINTNFGINRLVILCDKNLYKYLLKNEKNVDLNKFKQCTLKLMQPSNSKINEIDTYISKNKCGKSDTTNFIYLLNKYFDNVRLDTNCQDSLNRYEIFREDARVYSSWEEL